MVEEIDIQECTTKIKDLLLSEIPQLKSESLFVLSKCKNDIIKAEEKLLSTPPTITDTYSVLSHKDGGSETCIAAFEIEKYKNFESTYYISGINITQDSLRRIESYSKAIELISHVKDTDQLNIIFSELSWDSKLALSCTYNNNYKQRDKMNTYYESMQDCHENLSNLVIKFDYSNCINDEIV